MIAGSQRVQTYRFVYWYGMVEVSRLHVQISHLMPVYLAVMTTAAYAAATTQGPTQASRATGTNN